MTLRPLLLSWLTLRLLLPWLTLRLLLPWLTLRLLLLPWLTLRATTTTALADATAATALA